MDEHRADTKRRQATWWLAVSITCWLLAIVALIAAINFQRDASQPIGEGEVFINDVDTVSRLVATPMDLDEAVRHARNELDVEAVSMVDNAGNIVATTSDSFLNTAITNPLLGFGSESGRFVALAGPVDFSIEIDDVIEWPANSVLYQVLSPLPDGSSVLIHYDVSQLLSRRTQPGDIHSGTIQFLSLAGIFVILGLAVTIGHRRAARRYRDMVIESETLRSHSYELRAANAELDQARRAADQARALAEEKLRVRSEFVLMINHELRTPLTSVVTGAQLLQMKELSPHDEDEVIEAMAADGQRLQEIINQMLAVARIENRGLIYELKDLPFSDVSKAVCSSHPALTPTEPHPRDDTMVTTDLTTLSLVVASLVDNAKTHGARNVTVGCGSEPTVPTMAEAGVRPENGMVITVADDGPGIHAEFLPRIFEKFEKASFSSGTGLGLYMVRLMIEALDCSISVATSDKGTTFEIVIPVATASNVAVLR